MPIHTQISYSIQNAFVKRKSAKEQPFLYVKDKGLIWSLLKSKQSFNPNSVLGYLLAPIVDRHLEKAVIQLDTA